MTGLRPGVVLVLLGSMAVVGTAAARPVGISLRATGSCPTRIVYVRLADGSIRRVAHVVPGPTVRRIGRRVTTLMLALRVSRGWSGVEAWPGQQLDVTAAGPHDEAWAWRFRLRSRNPLADATDYHACLRLRMRGNRAFVRHLRTVRGAWTFVARVTRGSLRGSHDQTGVLVR